MFERRSFTSELRIDGREKEPIIDGHAAVFNQRSEEMWGFREIIRPGAFAETIKTADVRALWNHDPNFVLGRTKNRTLELSEDEIGLRAIIHPPDTIFANDIVESIKRGDVDQMSFGFQVITDEWRMEEKTVVRELIKLELFDVSPVTFPAYPQTDVQANEASKYFEARMKNLSPAAPPKEQIRLTREKHAAMRQKMTEKLWF